MVRQQCARVLKISIVAVATGGLDEKYTRPPCSSVIQKCMDSRNHGWDLYRTFLAVVQEGSLSGAARRVGIAQPTAGRHVRALERSVGASLFTRSQHGLSATQAARILVPHAEAMAAAADALTRASSGEARGESGTVRLTAGEMMGCELLPPMLAEFTRRYRGFTWNSHCQTATSTYCGATRTSPCAWYVPHRKR